LRRRPRRRLPSNNKLKLRKRQRERLPLPKPRLLMPSRMQLKSRKLLLRLSKRQKTFTSRRSKNKPNWPRKRQKKRRRETQRS
jgi:hypothetical protein